VSIPQFAAKRSRPIESIYIGSVVDGLDNARFRSLLKAELERTGLRVTETRETADAELSGKVIGWSETGGVFHALLADRDGKRLWEASVPRAIRTHKISCEPRDTATALAQKLAKAVHSARLRSETGE